jgi:hypothetical protein
MFLPHRWRVFRAGLEPDYGVTVPLGPYAMLSIPDVPDEIPPALSIPDEMPPTCIDT